MTTLIASTSKVIIILSLKSIHLAFINYSFWRWFIIIIIIVEIVIIPTFSNILVCDWTLFTTCVMSIWFTTFLNFIIIILLLILLLKILFFLLFWFLFLLYFLTDVTISLLRKWSMFMVISFIAKSLSIRVRLGIDWQSVKLLRLEKFHFIYLII